MHKIKSIFIKALAWIVGFGGRSPNDLPRIEPVRERKSKDSTEYKFGEIVDGVISGISQKGVFVELPNGESGLVQSGEITWLGQPNTYKIRQHVRVSIGKFKPGTGVSLSLKRAETKGEFEKFLLAENENGVFNGRVKNVLDYGVFVQIKPGVEGLLHNSAIPSGHYFSRKSIGEEIVVKVVSVDAEKGRIALELVV
jgi:small subunit ribosomal protein S1